MQHYKKENTLFEHYSKKDSFMLVFASASNLILDFAPSKKTKGREQVQTGMFPLINLCRWWGQGTVPLHRGAGGDWNATAECQTLCPDEIIRDSREAELHRSVPQIQKTRPDQKNNAIEKTPNNQN